MWQDYESIRALRICLQLFIKVSTLKSPNVFEPQEPCFIRSEIKSRSVFQMKQTWRQKSEAINRLSTSTVSLEGSPFPSGLLLVQRSFIRFQETLYVVLSVSLAKIHFFSSSLIPDCVCSQTSEETKREISTRQTTKWQAKLMPSATICFQDTFTLTGFRYLG